MDRKKIIKDDINFLEYPNWIVTEREKVKEVTIEKEYGVYKLFTGVDRLPDRFDKIVLYYLLSLLLKVSQLELTEIKTTRYKVAKGIFYKTKNVGKSEYKRIMTSLKRWTAIFIEFNGIFYDGNEYTNQYFHIVDNVTLNEKTKELSIKFNEVYIKQLRETNYFKLINFDEYKLLKRPVSARLYEILIKTFKDRDQWQIDIIKLGEKLTLEKRYPSQILEKLIPAVNEINKNTTLKIHLDYNKETHICTFTKVKQNQVMELEAKPKEANLPEDDNFKNLITLLPKEHQEKKTILEAVASAYRKQGFDYVSRNIRYTTWSCKGNYRAYLTKALKEDWGLALKEDEEAKQKIIDKQQEQKRQEREALDRQKEMRCKVHDYIKNLSSEKIELIREEAVGRLDEKMKKYAEEYGTYDTIIEITMNQIVEECLTAAR